MSLVALVVLAAAAAHSEELGRVVAARQKLVTMYDAPDGATLGKAAADGLPWVIQDEKNDFFMVSLHGRNVWVDSMEVRAARPSTDNCVLVSEKSQSTSIAGSPAASARRCK